MENRTKQKGNLLEEDPLHRLVHWVEMFLFEPPLRQVFYFFFSLHTFYILYGTYLLISNFNRKFWLTCGLFFFITSFVYLYSLFPLFKRKEIIETKRSVFPKFMLWHQANPEVYLKLLKAADSSIKFSYIFIIFSLIGATGSLPWFKEDYDESFALVIWRDIFGSHKSVHWFSIILAYTHLYHGTLMEVGLVIFFMYLVLHLRAQIILLGDLLTPISKNSDLELYDNQNYQNYVESQLKQFIHHQLIVEEFVLKINGYIYYAMLTVAPYCIVVFVCVFLYMMTLTFAHIVHGTVLFTCIVGGAIFEVWLGQIVINESENLLYKLNELPWYTWSNNNKKILNLIILKSKKPFKFSFAGLVDIELTVILKVYKLCYAFLTFLLNVN